MNISEYKNIYTQEKSHFFYVSTHHLFENIVKQFAHSIKTEILDIGCGTGLLAKKLSKYGIVKGIDFSSEAIKYAKKNGINAVNGSILEIPCKNNSFDIVVCVDVLVSQSIKDDRKALKEIHRVLKPGGILILRVSAIKWLELAHDRFVQSIRRYNKNELSKKITDSGLITKRIFYIHFPLLPIAIFRHFYEKIFDRHSSHSGIEYTPNWLNSAATKILNTESHLALKGFAPPLGMGLVAIAQKS